MSAVQVEVGQKLVRQVNGQLRCYREKFGPWLEVVTVEKVWKKGKIVVRSEMSGQLQFRPFGDYCRDDTRAYAVTGQEHHGFLRAFEDGETEESVALQMKARTEKIEASRQEQEAARQKAIQDSLERNRVNISRMVKLVTAAGELHILDSVDRYGKLHTKMFYVRVESSDFPGRADGETTYYLNSAGSEIRPGASAGIYSSSDVSGKTFEEALGKLLM